MPNNAGNAFKPAPSPSEATEIQDMKDAEEAAAQDWPAPPAPPKAFLHAPGFVFPKNKPMKSMGQES
jgi:hypothetical protein